MGRPARRRVGVGQAPTTKIPKDFSPSEGTAQWWFFFIQGGARRGLTRRRAAQPCRVHSLLVRGGAGPGSHYQEPYCTTSCAGVVSTWSTFPARPGGRRLFVIWYYQRGAADGCLAVLESPRAALRDWGRCHSVKALGSGLCSRSRNPPGALVTQ